MTNNQKALHAKGFERSSAALNLERSSAACGGRCAQNHSKIYFKIYQNYYKIHVQFNGNSRAPQAIICGHENPAL
ncbi:MAG: hypothetical protein IJK43_11980 [Prevotella sp.]|nr:hypothetical protein [Prevotella sp.]